MSEIADAVHADAEAARAEIRAAGIACPSCGVNLADLPNVHMLVLDMGAVDWERAERRPRTARCQDGTLVPMDDASFETWQAAVNVNLYDKWREAMDAEWSKEMGFDVRGEWPPFPGFTGLADVLRDC